jgi:hypothetical protein
MTTFPAYANCSAASSAVTARTVPVAVTAGLDCSSPVPKPPAMMLSSERFMATAISLVRMPQAAPPPTALNKPTSCGIAVIFTRRAATSPAVAPASTPTARTTAAVAVIVPASSSTTTVSAIADSWLPRRAVAGELSGAGRARSRPPYPDREGASWCSSLALRPRVEHLEHPVGHAVDRVRAGHQRGVQSGRDLRNDLEPTSTLSTKTVMSASRTGVMTLSPSHARAGRP